MVSETMADTAVTGTRETLVVGPATRDCCTCCLHLSMVARARVATGRIGRGVVKVSTGREVVGGSVIAGGSGCG